MIWLCIDFPLLALEVLTRTLPDNDRVCVVVENRQLSFCPPEAAQHGIRIGLSVSTAQALFTELRILERRPAQEQAALEALADCALRFSPMVSLQPSQALLLEIAGSLRLFDGLDNLFTQLQTVFKAQGFSLHTALAPTAEAAWLLASNGAGDGWRQYCDAATGRIDPSRFLERLGELPVNTLGGSARQQQQMGKTGFRSLSDILSLPGAALGRRFGKDFLQRIERIRGTRPDPRKAFLPPQAFAATLQFPDGLAEIGMLRFPLHRLLQDLTGFLRRRQTWCQALCWQLYCNDQTSQRLTVRCSTPGHDSTTLLELSLLQLEALQLSAPIEGIELYCDNYAPLEPRHAALFAEPGTPTAQAGALLLDRLRTRLSTEQLHGIRCQAEHLPEQAWQRSEVLSNAERKAATVSLSAKPRPVWLLPEPRPIDCNRQGPYWQGSLSLLNGPERIESCWWQGEAPRDYFIAQHSNGALYWIFRRVNDGRWFMQGLFA